MKKEFLVTSVIDTDNNYPLTYSKTRSHFSNDERLRQTIFTLTSLDHVIDDDTTIFLVDASEQSDLYKNILSYQRNLVYVDVRKEFPEVYNLIKTHPHKSYCESILQLSFYDRYKDRLKEYDYHFKMSGRYFFDSNFNLDLCTEGNKNKFFFKRPLEFDWNDNWGYSMVDRRAEQNDNKLRQYSSVLYGWGNDRHDQMIDIYRVISEFTSNPNTYHYDIETLLYFFTRQFQSDVIETNWKVFGWTGVDGTFLRY